MEVFFSQYSIFTYLNLSGCFYWVECMERLVNLFYMPIVYGINTDYSCIFFTIMSMYVESVSYNLIDL